MTYKILDSQGGALIKAWVDGVNIEPQAVEQLQKIAKLPFIFKHIAVMPDVHLGIGATVGSVVATKGAIIPAAVGVDIGCLDHETEYLTSTGWKKISEYQKGEEILIYDPATKISWFEEPQAYIEQPSNGFFHFLTKYGINQKVSSEHRMLLYKSGRLGAFEKYEVTQASIWNNEHNTKVSGSGERINTTPETILINSKLPYTDDQLRVIVMTAADAHVTDVKTPTAVLKFAKERKYKRALEILTGANCEIISHGYNENIYSIRYKMVTNIKTLTQLWGASLPQLQVISVESLEWDGNIKDMVFFTRLKEEADFIQWAFLASGFRAVQRLDGVDYRVFAHSNTKVGIKATPKSKIDFVPSIDGKEYCFTVSTGFFLIRCGGVTAITGNCGMIAMRTSLTASDLPESLVAIRSDMERAIPHGFVTTPGRSIKGAFEVTPQSICTRWSKLSQRYFDLVAKHPEINHKKAQEQVGTLGGGNHFVELCLDEVDRVWVMLHSGSRGPGNVIGTHFIDIAKKDMRVHYINLPDENLAYLPEGTKHYDDYIEAMTWAQDYAVENRLGMMDAALMVLRKHVKSFTLEKEAINCHHNYATKENHFGQNVMITRKGAVRAREGDLGIIPGSMGAKSFIVRGLGNKDSFCSCSHGAGRKMSRNEAKKTFTLDDHLAATKGVECRKDVDVLDETPGAYKDIYAVMSSQSDLVEIVHTLKQVMCIKG